MDPADVPIAHRWTTIDGRRVHAYAAGGVRGAGARPPVVLVHGWVISGRYMLPTLRRLAADFAVYAPDLPGHGRSDTPPRALDIAGYAEALVAWMDATGLARALLVGNSLGCQVVARVAASHPARVAGIVLVGPTVDAAARSASVQAWRLLRDAVRERPSLLFLELADMLRVGPRRMVAMARATLADRIEDVLPRVRVPAVVVRGEHDTLVPRAWTAHVAALLGTTPVEIPGAPHGVNYSAPEALATIVRGFAAALRDPACSTP